MKTLKYPKFHIGIGGIMNQQTDTINQDVSQELKGMQLFELSPCFDARQSFYGKARVIKEGNGDLTLVSYNTKVATIKGDKAVVFGTHSQTTLRHIKEFLLQNGFEAINKKQIIKDYME